MILHRLNLGYSKPPLHVYEVDSSMFASAGTQQALNARRGYYTSKQDILSPLTVWSRWFVCRADDNRKSPMLIETEFALWNTVTASAAC